ncbi:Molybdenum cofactor biosynthesis protein B [Corynebacterium ciconiae DSM 44920]|uniref:MogA/MoaB family molybdenum cofactor biosynthesis protein n=1 Tax=Corynebacterium ciconiae TaxID=227319 RepID=UPI0003718B28|nr:MogA/MoaB family molybdenum cofactor biosynthesis protein [Corynebacterium ciconiae]WKD60971.1 Molybdenum cofactor biosynthesis protein B [Corynebacterium ciconiae DSM 44920]
MNESHAHCESDAHRSPRPLESMPEIPGAVITVSDRCARGERQDLSGPKARQGLCDYGVTVGQITVVEDGVESVQEAIIEAIEAGARVVFTTGGTGVSPRDLTPEATAPLLDVQLHQISTQILLRGLQATPLAALSRGLVGIARRASQRPAVIINAPGSRGGVADVLAVVGPLLSHIVDQMDGASEHEHREHEHQHER